MQYVSPDDWKDEKVTAEKYPLTEDGRIYGARLVGLELGRQMKDVTGPKRVVGILADAADGFRLHFPERDTGRNLGPFKDDRKPDGHLWLHKWPITPIEELQTPWVSVYGHAPGVGYGMSHCLLSPTTMRFDDELCVIGRFETYRAEKILARLDDQSPREVKIFLEWLKKPGRFAQHSCDNLPNAQWITYGVPAVLWCCRPAEAETLWRAMASMLSDELIAAYAKNKGAEKTYREADPRLVMAEHLLSVTKVGEPARYLAAAAFRQLSSESNFWAFQNALARKSFNPSTVLTTPISELVERLGLTDDDLHLLSEAERLLGVQ
jgi:hypothetical protein